MNDPILCEFQTIDPAQAFEIAIVTLNRPDKANALNEDMIQYLHNALDLIEKRTSCRLVILRSNGKHFCSGADLAWMKKSAQLSFDENVKDAEELGSVFERLSLLNIPTLALAQGSSAGGALGLLACCDIVLALDDAQFSLREVRIGLLPAMILPYLALKVERSALLRVGLTGETFDALEAERIGLVARVCTLQTVDKVLRETIQLLLEGGPTAQGSFKELFRALTRGQKDWNEVRGLCVQAIAKARTGNEGQKGLAAFLNKEKPHWVQTIAETWMIS